MSAPVDVDALPAGRELDAMIAERVFGEPTMGGGRYGPTYRRTGLGGAVPRYSTDLAAAWRVAEKLNIGVLPDCPDGRERGGWLAGSHPDWWQSSVSWVEASLYEGPGPGKPWVIAETPALAICRAALKAVSEAPSS